MSSPQPKATDGANSKTPDASQPQGSAAPAIPPFAEYGKTGYLAYEFINRKIAKQTPPLTWNVHGVTGQVKKITEDGQLLCTVAGTSEESAVMLDDTGFENLLKKLVF